MTQSFYFFRVVRAKRTRQDIKVKASVPALPTSLSFIPRQTFTCLIIELIPSVDKLSDIASEVRLKFQDTFLRKDMGYDLPLPRVLGSITGIEEPAVDRDKGIIEVRFERSRAMTVDSIQGLWVSDRNVIGGNADNGTLCFQRPLVRYYTHVRQRIVSYRTVGGSYG